jgi:hypothetical protein
MNQEIKNCQNCKKEFALGVADFSFYEKIKTPLPSWCPDCRLQRRLVWRNERALYKRKCDSCGTAILSIYQPNGIARVYCPQCWWGDNWDQTASGLDYDFSQTFFEQLGFLQAKAPVVSLNGKNNIDSTYFNYASDLKNCYLVFSSINVENGAYFARGLYVKDVMDIWQTRHSERCYETFECNKCYNLLFSKYCDGCSDSALLYDCRNCSHCFGCCNLRSKQYCIFNEQYSREEYLAKIKEMELGSFAGLNKAKEDFSQLVVNFPKKYAMKSINSSGDDLANVANCSTCFQVQDEVRDCQHLVLVADRVNDVADATYGGFGLEKGFELLGCVGNNILFSGHAWYSFNIQYSHNCVDCHDLFACIGLRNKQYCILNKQYSKEEYETLVPKIISHMNDMPYISRRQKSKVKSQNYNSKDKNEETTETEEIVYRYGEFFPPELSPFCYNETIAQEYFPLTKEQAIEQGYNWRDPEPRNYQINIKSQDLPDNIKDVKDDILTQVIECANAKSLEGQTFQCTEAFRIIEPELAFYRRMNLPLPRLCPNCRHYQRLKQRNPLKLWQRQCMCQGTRGSPSAVSLQRKDGLSSTYQNTCQHEHAFDTCENTFQTTYASNRPELVYCEQCYLKEVL